MSVLDKIIVIVGVTGGGKTGVGVELALALHAQYGVAAEVISADSRAIYKGMDIGTAKPTMAERAGVKHHGFDLVLPGEYFSAADFKEYALARVAEIRARGHIPIIVGGSGMWIDAILYDYRFAVEEGVLSGSDSNPRHKNTAPVDRNRGVGEEFIVVGIEVGKEEIEERLRKRVEMMFEEGLVDEVNKLCVQYGKNTSVLQSHAYKACINYLFNGSSLEEAKAEAFKYDKMLVKKQRTWFRRNKEIEWLPREQIVGWVLKNIAV